MEKTLPIKYPMITSYPEIANLMSILETDERAIPWICSNLNQIVFKRANNYVNGMQYEMQFNRQFYKHYSNIPILEYNQIHKNIISMKWPTFSDFIVELIENGYYIQTHLDHYYMPNSWFYHKSNYFHSTFIYGYDSDQGTIKIADFYMGNKYDHYNISSDSMNKAFNGSISQEVESFNYIILIKIKENYISPPINMRYMKRSLLDYIESKDSFNLFEYSTEWSDFKFYFGLSYYDELIKELHQDKLRRSMHVVYDHAKITKYKLKILHERDYINQTDFVQLNELICTIEHLALVNRNKYLKIYIKNRENIDRNVLDLLAKNILNLKEESENFTLKLIDAIKE